MDSLIDIDRRAGLCNVDKLVILFQSFANTTSGIGILDRLNIPYELTKVFIWAPNLSAVDDRRISSGRRNPDISSFRPADFRRTRNMVFLSL